MNGLTFDPVRHSYALDGLPVGRSVTQVLHRAGLIDFSGVPDGILENARRRGTIVHQAIHFYNQGDLDQAGFEADYPDLTGYLAGWQRFCNQRRFRSHLAEWRVCSPLMSVAGTIDCLGELDHQGVLLDFATGNPADVAKDLQTAAYQLLAYEWQARDAALRAFITAFPAIRRFSVALHADGTFNLERYENRRDFSAFRTLADAQAIVDARRRKGVAA